MRRTQLKKTNLVIRSSMSVNMLFCVIPANPRMVSQLNPYQQYDSTIANARESRGTGAMKSHSVIGQNWLLNASSASGFGTRIDYLAYNRGYLAFSGSGFSPKSHYLALEVLHTYDSTTIATALVSRPNENNQGEAAR